MSGQWAHSRTKVEMRMEIPPRGGVFPAHAVQRLNPVRFVFAP